MSFMISSMTRLSRLRLKLQNKMMMKKSKFEKLKTSLQWKQSLFKEVPWKTRRVATLIETLSTLLLETIWLRKELEKEREVPQRRGLEREK